MGTSNEREPWRQSSTVTAMPTARKPRPTPGGPGPSRGKKRRGPGRTIAAALSIAAIAGIALYAGKLAQTVYNATGRLSPRDTITLIKNPRGQFPASKNRINILLLGVDYSYLWTKKNVALNGARYTKESRSDSIMMLSLDLDSKKVSALSVPRDTWVTDPTGHRGKINGAYKRGGPKLSAQTVGELLGVMPDYYVAVEPDAVKSVVDELGGVNVETIDAMQYDDAAAGLHINLPEGKQTINGDQAIGFARFREADTVERDETGHGIPTGAKDSEGNPIFKRKRAQDVVHSKEEGDPRRMARQQQLIRAVADKGKQPDNLLRADKIIDAGMAHIKTNLSRPQLIALLALFKGIQTDQMQTGTLEGKGVLTGSYKFLPDERKKEALVDWLLKGDEKAANRLTVVAVQNGTGVPGLAKRVADRLRAQGFDAKPDGNAPLPVGETGIAATRIVYGKAAVAPRVEKIRQLLGGGKPVKEVQPDLQGAEGFGHSDVADVTVILGRDLATGTTPRRAAL